jgi:hypothetical protein
VNKSGRGDIGLVYRVGFRIQRENIVSFVRRLFRFVKPLLYSETKAAGKEALNLGSNILTDILHKEPEQPIGDNFKTCFGEAQDNLEQKKDGGVWFGFENEA